MTKRSEMEEAVSSFVARAAEKMRRQRLATDSLVVFIHTNRFKPDEPQYYAARPVRLPVASADTGKLIQAALHGLAEIWRDKYAYTKAGVVFPTLQPAANVQGDLFGLPDSARSQQLMRTLDALNRRYGRSAITFATLGRKQGWKLRSEHLSPRFTTSWDELLRV